MAGPISQAIETATVVKTAPTYFMNAGLSRVVRGIDYLNRYNSGIVSNDMTLMDFRTVGEERKKILDDVCEDLYFAAAHYAYAAGIEHEHYTLSDELSSLERLRKFTRIAQRIASVSVTELDRDYEKNDSSYLGALEFAAASLGAFVALYSNFSYPQAKADYYGNNIDQGFSEIQAGIRDTEEKSEWANRIPCES